MDKLPPITAEHLRLTAAALCRGNPIDELECHPAYRAAERIEQLEKELQAANDYSDDRASMLDMVREKLGIPAAPHQGMDERILEAAEHVLGAQDRCIKAQVKYSEVLQKATKNHQELIDQRYKHQRVCKAASDLFELTKWHAHHDMDQLRRLSEVERTLKEFGPEGGPS